MTKILIGGAGGTPSEGVINSLLQIPEKEEITGMGSVAAHLILSNAVRKYLIPYANIPQYKNKLMKVLVVERPGLIHFQNGL